MSAVPVSAAPAPETGPPLQRIESTGFAVAANAVGNPQLPLQTRPLSIRTTKETSGSSAGPGSAPDSLQIEALKGWHLPLLNDPSFLPLHSLLQRALLLAWPERLISALAPHKALAPEVLVALDTSRSGHSRALGLITSQRLNRTGTCWKIQHLLLASGLEGQPRLPSEARIRAALLREAIQRQRGAASWIATASSDDGRRLCLLREQGFQPLRTDRLWRWPQAVERDSAPTAPLASDLSLRCLNRRNATMLWHLEQAACPALLRQLLDRRIEDLLDQSRGRGWMLVDASRNMAVAGLRWIADEPGGETLLEFSLHPGWRHLLGPPCELLMKRARSALGSLRLRCDVTDLELQSWLEQLGAVEHGDEVLMARSVWKRQERRAARRGVPRLDTVLEQLQPRRRPMPSPANPLPTSRAGH